jgi:hypothetical protein
MYKALVALGFSLIVGACAGTMQSTKTAAQECRLVDQDATGTHISVRQECDDAGGKAAGAPNR